MIGSIVYATNQGLGILAKSFFDNGLIDKVIIKSHSTYKNHYDWYSTASVTTEDSLLNKLTHLLIFETPFDWKIIPKARELGVKVILIPMYECTRFPFPYEPDEIWCPSQLDYDFYKSQGKENLKLIQIPVDVKWKLRTRARVFIHNAGNGGIGGRNGTKELIEAMKYVKSPIKLIIRTQTIDFKCDDPRVEIRFGTTPYESLWTEGDVFIFPEKFNGLSLPLQEAYASGMLVMCGARHPMTTWLPNEPMIPVRSYKKERIAVEFDMAEYSPEDIAERIDFWYDKDITNYSLLGKEWGKTNSWKNLEPIYKTLFTTTQQSQ